MVPFLPSCLCVLLFKYNIENIFINIVVVLVDQSLGTSVAPKKASIIIKSCKAEVYNATAFCLISVNLYENLVMLHES